MPRYADSDKEKVREAIDMVDLVSTKTELRRAGPGRFKGLCPFHDERTPSFSVNADEGFYHCFGCGVGGDAFGFVMATEGLDFVGALESLAGRYGVELTVEDEDPQAAERRRHRERLLELLERAAGFYERWLWESAEAAPARLYLAERGLSDETLRTYRVGYAPSAWDKLLMAGRQQSFSNREIFEAGLAVRSNKGKGRIYDRFRRRIMFPLCDARGRVLGFGARALGADQMPKYLNSADGDIFHKGDIVYGAHHARVAATRADEVIAAEGYTDVLALHQAGMANVVGIMGTALTEKQVGELAKLGKTVLLALDADSAGQEAMLRAAKLAAGRRLQLRVVPLPKGLDPADLVQAQGAEAAKGIVGASVPFVRFQIERELASGDLTHAEGKDAVIAALRPVFATLPPSALREELLAHVADRLDLQASLVSSWLPVAPAGGASSSSGGGARAPRRTPGGSRGGGSAPWGEGSPAQEPWGGGSPYDDEDDPGRWGEGTPATPVRRAPSANPVLLAERAFLAQCLAAPDPAEELLGRLSDDVFTGEFMQRLVAHVRANLRTPTRDLPDDDEALGRAVAALLADAEPLSNSATVLRRELAYLEMARAERDIAEARRSGSGSINELRSVKDRAKERWEQLLQQSMDETMPAR